MLVLEELINNGVIIVDKPPKLSSHETTSLVKKILGAKRAGHAGTLDPKVSGVLPIALGRATKLLDFIVAKDKIYTGIIKFKIPQTNQKILDLFEKFTGEIMQTPPKISAVRKVRRKRTIYYINLLEQNGRYALFETKTQAGTYIRTLCTDIGKLTGGARMEELRRIAVGEIFEESAVKMHDLVDAVWLWKERNNPKELLKIIKPPEDYLKNYKKVFIKNSTVQTLLNGAQLMAPGLLCVEDFSKNEKIAIYTEDKKFVGMGLTLFSSDELKKIKQGQVVKIIRIHFSA